MGKLFLMSLYFCLFVCLCAPLLATMDIHPSALFENTIRRTAITGKEDIAPSLEGGKTPPIGLEKSIPSSEEANFSELDSKGRVHTSARRLMRSDLSEKKQEAQKDDDHHEEASVNKDGEASVLEDDEEHHTWFHKWLLLPREYGAIEHYVKTKTHHRRWFSES